MNPKFAMSAMERVITAINPDYPAINCEKCGNRLICLTDKFICIEIEKLKTKFDILDKAEDDGFNEVSHRGF